jgi:hypothetical protein
MSKYISVGHAAIAISDLRKLSGADKIRILDAMFDGNGLDTDNHGQIVQYTGLAYSVDGGGTKIVSFNSIDTAVETSHNEDPYETEEEPESSEAVSSAYMLDESLPPTLRPSQFPRPS